MTDPRALATFCAHGGRVARARALFGGDDWIDLSTGIAPWAWPSTAVDQRLDRLPEPDAIQDLEAAAAAAFGGADPAQVVAVPGTDLAMRLLAPLLQAQRPAVRIPAYAGHLAAWPNARPITDLADRRLDGSDLVVLASPANPDGRRADATVVLSLSKAMTVIVDEAYADPEEGLCPQASDRLIVLRSFGKFYGLPGLRLGFVVAGGDVAAALRATLGDWPVSSPAVAIGQAAYRDAVWRRAQHDRTLKAGAALDTVLAGAGLTIVGAAPLFRLIACDDAPGLFEALARRAILTRPFSDQPDRLRIGLPASAAARARLAHAITEYQS